MQGNGGNLDVIRSYHYALYLDMIFSDMDRIPQYGEEVFAENFDMQLGGGSLVPAILLNRLKVESKLGTF